MKRKPAGNSRQKLIDAAEELALRDGVSALTLDRVAAEARVSKGGLLYHFPSKDALIEAMVDRHLRTFAGALDQARKAERPGAGRFTRAVLRAAFRQSVRPPERERRMAVALLAAVANRPALLEPAREAYERWLDEACGDGLAPGRSIAVLAALDGLWLWNLFGLARLSPTRSRAVRRALKALAGASRE